MPLKSLLLVASVAWILMPQTAVLAEVKSKAPDGFQIRIDRKSAESPQETMKVLVHRFNEWWDASHSYSGDPKNLSMDLQQRCMLEQLPDGGFVRHMEIVFYQPGKLLRLSGGLGPLQGMGVQGALTFSLESNGQGTQIRLTYNVAGAELMQLDQVAAAVDQVLTEQMDRLQETCQPSE